MATPIAAMSTASAILALSKSAWKVGTSLSKLDQDILIVDTTRKNLAGEVKTLANECDLLYAELEEVVTESEKVSPLPYDVDGKIWNCLVTQVEETGRTIQELELFVKIIREASSSISQAQRQRKLDNSTDQIASIRTKVFDKANLARSVLTHIAPCRADQELPKKLDKLEDVIEKLQRSSETDSKPQSSQLEATLMECAREIIVKGMTMMEANMAMESITKGESVPNGEVRVTEWVNNLEAQRWYRRRSDPSDMVSNVSSVFSSDDTQTLVTSDTSTQRALQERKTVDTIGDDSDDDLNIDLAKAALDTGTKAFEAREWDEADSLLQEALRILQQLSAQQTAFCDVFDLHYKIAVCAYHTKEPAGAEEALMHLVQQSANSDKQREYICDAAHLLSHLYIRRGQLDRARSQCEKALQARRRLLGKHSDAALESTALMAHTYVLLNNNARAKSCLAMIPEARRDAVLKKVENSLGMKIGHLDTWPQLNRSMSEDSDLRDLRVKRIESNLSESSLSMSVADHCYGPVPPTYSQSPDVSLQQSEKFIPLNTAGLEDLHPMPLRLSSVEKSSDLAATEKQVAMEDYSVLPEALDTINLSQGEPPKADDNLKGKTLSRKEILDRIGCRPKDGLEDAVCDGDYPAFISLLNSKKSFWRSKLRKHVRPERVTALHFAALFGEVEMARRLLDSNFNVSEVPYGYSTSLTPLKFAIGARQVEMVEFLVANGARPTEPDSWSTLAGQLMNRSWLMKTMSEAEREFVPDRISAILRTLLQHGWDVNAPLETSGKTILHQAVTFWTGSYRWDMNLRAAMTSFLCDIGADPFRADTQGQTPYAMASASGHEDLLLVLSQAAKRNDAIGPQVEPVELSGDGNIV